MNKRNGKIDFLRFLFSLVIVLHHSRYLLGDDKSPFLGGSFAVEFFFLVSGYLMMASIDKRRDLPCDQLGSETLRYVFGKAKALWPHALIAWIIAIAVRCICRSMRAAEVLTLICNTFYEVTFLKMSGIAATPINGVVWYVSSMLLAMAVLYPLIRKYRDMALHVILPLVTLLTLGYMAMEFGSIRTPTQWIGFTFKGNLRALAELSLGAICYPLGRKLSSLSLTKFARGLLAVAEVALWILLVIYMIKSHSGYMDCLFLALMALAVTISFSGAGFGSDRFNCKFFYFLGKWAMPLFLGHTYLAQNLNYVLPANLSDGAKTAIYLAASACTSFFIWGTSSLFIRTLPCWKRAARRLFIEE